MNLGYASKCLRAALICCCWAATGVTPALAEQDERARRCSAVALEG
jgi:hypothetical protein